MKVFISSTIYELLDLRSELYEFLTASGYDVVISEIGSSGFEVTENSSSIECCLSNVRSCDVLILIADRRYGPTLEKYGYDKRSATHLEYDAAIESTIPVYVYLRDRTDAELSLYKLAIKKGHQWNGGEWVSKKDVGLLEMLFSHSKLKQKDAQNWLTIFRSSVDLKQSIANQLRLPRYNHDLPRLIASGNVPILSIKVDCDYLPNASAVKFTANIYNQSKYGVFIKQMGWFDKELNEPQVSNDLTFFPVSDETSSTFLHGIDTSQAYKNHFTLVYSTYDGLTVDELWEGHYYFASQTTMVRGMSLLKRKFRIEQAINMNIE